METAIAPQLEVLQTGKLMKILRVKGTIGMEMPVHHSTKEAVVVVQKGSATLYMEGNEYQMSEGVVPSYPLVSFTVLR